MERFDINIKSTRFGYEAWQCLLYTDISEKTRRVGAGVPASVSLDIENIIITAEVAKTRTIASLATVGTLVVGLGEEGGEGAVFFLFLI